MQDVINDLPNLDKDKFKKKKKRVVTPHKNNC